ncbi:CPXCG motif-containing cysteine-rich protein [Opitutaceae bacterium EW11]|nr:CPXCG motif-containing cysteine-rich protein [Opitutaceae bacterium EW11]
MPEFITVICPACGERFEIPTPESEELPAELDYDCEICCRPMTVTVEVLRGQLRVESHGIAE